VSLHADAVATLTAWSAPSASQDALRRGYLDYLAAHPDAMWRDGPPGHLTGSCLVLDERGERTLLTFHRKGRFWVQFGGHCEPGDATIGDVALREGREESGLGGIVLLPGPVDLDRHALSSAFGRCREHLDVAYLAVAPAAAEPVVGSESDDVAWWPLDALPPDIVPDLPRRLARAATLLPHLGASGPPRE
jgi:8-oxo-dGTP pyrophosphatase MutT (NUDIX family)